MIELDGKLPPGGGQLLRYALAFSAYTNKAFSIKNIRSSRPRPGLSAQHLHAVKALQQLTNASVEGASLGSTNLVFKPYGYTPAPIDISIGTAGSISLLLQSLMLPAMHHKKTKYTVSGGTDVLWSPPIDYTRFIVAPLLDSFGLCKIDLQRRGYFPQGGGVVEATFGKANSHKPLTLIERGHLQQITVVCNASQSLMDRRVCEDMEQMARVLLDDLDTHLTIRNFYANSRSEGFGITVYATHAINKPRVLIGASGVADNMASPNEVARDVCRNFRQRLEGDGVVDENLADHLIPFIAIHGGELIVNRVSNHIIGAIRVAEAFTKCNFTINGKHITVSRVV